MESNIIESVSLTGGVVVADFSVLGLFLRSDFVIKAVMALLFFGSVWSWTIIIEKGLRFRRLAKQARSFEDSFWSGGSLEDLFEEVGNKPNNPMASIFSSAMGEWRRSSARGLIATETMRERLQERIDRVMEVSLGREIERLDRYMVFLASAGATAPFIGLFGTVWGIMNSFQAIGAARDTNIAVVAPGLAEALFTTAMGLMVAIPAVFAFNKFNTDLTRYSQRLESFAAEFSGLLSRQLEERV